MEHTHLGVPERLECAAESLALRFSENHGGAIRPSEILVPQRQEDVENDLWRSYNAIQGGCSGAACCGAPRPIA
jgi:hypothetical protein